MLGKVQLEPVLGYNSFDVHRYKEYLQFVLDKDDAIAPRSGAALIENSPPTSSMRLRMLRNPFLDWAAFDSMPAGPRPSS